jgi:hypothetical protein
MVILHCQCNGITIFVAALRQQKSPDFYPGQSTGSLPEEARKLHRMCQSDFSSISAGGVKNCRKRGQPAERTGTSETSLCGLEARFHTQHGHAYFPATSFPFESP